MGFKALITIDITATSIQRDSFYEVLSKEKWNKIKPLTTTWKVTFIEETTREGVTKTLISDLKKAKAVSKVTNVEYAFQISKFDLSVGKI
jgi:hypothetical protein